MYGASLKTAREWPEKSLLSDNTVTNSKHLVDDELTQQNIYTHWRPRMASRIKQQPQLSSVILIEKGRESLVSPFQKTSFASKFRECSAAAALFGAMFVAGMDVHAGMVETTHPNNVMFKGATHVSSDLFSEDKVDRVRNFFDDHERAIVDSKFINNEMDKVIQAAAGQSNQLPGDSSVNLPAGQYQLNGMEGFKKETFLFERYGVVGQKIDSALSADLGAVAFAGGTQACGLHIDEKALFQRNKTGFIYDPKTGGMGSIDRLNMAFTSLTNKGTGMNYITYHELVHCFSDKLQSYSDYFGAPETQDSFETNVEKLKAYAKVKSLSEADKAKLVDFYVKAVTDYLKAYNETISDIVSIEMSGLPAERVVDYRRVTAYINFDSNHKTHTLVAAYFDQHKEVTLDKLESFIGQSLSNTALSQNLFSQVVMLNTLSGIIENVESLQDNLRIYNHIAAAGVELNGLSLQVSEKEATQALEELVMIGDRIKTQEYMGDVFYSDKAPLVTDLYKVFMEQAILRKDNIRTLSYAPVDASPAGLKLNVDFKTESKHSRHQRDGVDLV